MFGFRSGILKEDNLLISHCEISIKYITTTLKQLGHDDITEEIVENILDNYGLSGIIMDGISKIYKEEY